MTLLRNRARALGGDVAGNQILCPGPGHGPCDRSLSVCLDPQAPDLFMVHSFAGDSWQACRDHVRARLALPERERAAPVKPLRNGNTSNTDRARELWHEARDPRGTIVETYLASRGLDLPDIVCGDVLRFHPNCPWKDEASGETVRLPAMLAAMRNIITDELTAVHRTVLDGDGRKIGRRMLGAAAGAAIKIDGDAEVTHGLHIGEGVETCLAARQLGFLPVWALASAGAIAKFPLLAGIEALTLLREDDATGANARAVQECGARWLTAGREVLTVEPVAGGDCNDATMRAAS